MEIENIIKELETKLTLEWPDLVDAQDLKTLEGTPCPTALFSTSFSSAAKMSANEGQNLIAEQLRCLKILDKILRRSIQDVGMHKIFQRSIKDV